VLIVIAAEERPASALGQFRFGLSVLWPISLAQSMKLALVEVMAQKAAVEADESLGGIAYPHPAASGDKGVPMHASSAVHEVCVAAGWAGEYGRRWRHSGAAGPVFNPSLVTEN